MRRPFVLTLLCLPAVALAAGCGSQGAALIAANGTPGASPRPGASRAHAEWSRERMQREFLATSSATVTPSAHSPLARSVERVGALFYNDRKGDHFCTASVVTSPHHNLLLTAAHCIHGGKDGGYKNDLVFVPQYNGGSAPEGTWTVGVMTVDDRWIASSDPDLDVGFVSVEPQDGKQIEDVLGGNRLGIDQGFANVVRVTGYPANADAPISCLNKTSQQSAHQVRFSCNGYYGGTSGSPWISHFDRATRTGTVVGVIGGYQEGGDTQEVSYSPYFDADVQNLYNKAVAKG